MEKPAEFLHNGTDLRGILHLPESEKRKEAALFLNAGLVCRAGPERLYVDLARLLCRNGFASLRFDFPGIGNSGGDLGEVNMDMFANTSCTGPAIDLLLEHSGAESVMVIGMCTGGRSAVWTARRDTRVSSLVLLSMPITYDRTRLRLIEDPEQREGTNSRSITAGLAGRVKASPLRDVARRLIRSGRSVRYALNRYTTKAARTFDSMSGRPNQDPILREGMYRSCIELIRSGRKILFVYGRDDEPLMWDFAKHFPSDHPLSGSFDVCFVDDAGHSFSGFAPHAILKEQIISWANQLETTEFDV